MGKSAVFSTLTAAVVVLVATSRGDVARAAPRPQLAPSTEAVAEPITGTPATPTPGDETIAKDPFALYSVGAPGTKTWSYKDLPPAERAYVDRNAHSAAGSDAVHAAFAAAVQERAHAAAADAAAHQLGLPDGHLATLGVVP